MSSATNTEITSNISPSSVSLSPNLTDSYLSQTSGGCYTSPVYYYTWTLKYYDNGAWQYENYGGYTKPEAHSDGNPEKWRTITSETFKGYACSCKHTRGQVLSATITY